MTLAPERAFELPDTTAALPARPFEFSRAGWDQAEALAELSPQALFHRILRDQESEEVLLTARRILAGFLGSDTDSEDASAEAIAAEVAAVRAELAVSIDRLRQLEAAIYAAVLRQRAPLALLGGCWLDMVSQPATQPAIVVNRLYAQYFALRGGGNPLHDQQQLRRRALEFLDISLPELAAGDFMATTRARPLTALHGCFYLALSRLPANFLPEVVGVHYAFQSLGVDELLLGTSPTLGESLLNQTLAEYLNLAGPSDRSRLLRAVRLVLALEREHVALLTELGDWRSGMSLESKVAEIVGRHGPMSGRQHGKVTVGGALLAESFRDPELDLATFLNDFRESGFVRTGSDGISPFIQAMKFGGPMFGIFDESEAAILREWVASAQRGERPEIAISPNTVGDEPAARWAAAVAGAKPADVLLREAEPADHRELFHRLINIENFANTLPLAAEHARANLDAAEILFTHGAAGRYTDATYFDYTPEALYARGERVYWDKLVDPYQPLAEIPDRDEVIFTQSTYALGYLIDGAWLHKLANLGHDSRQSDQMLFSIYADEMGHGDLTKNHITLTHRVLGSLGFALPHIRDEAFMEQGDLPDDLYGFSLHQLSMCLLPDTFYNELLGYNFAIEMFGSGEVRLHEMQKLRHHGFDDCYEQAHLAIDNFSAGHTKQAADIIVSYLDGVRRVAGEGVVQQEWRRIWRGYASFAYFVEHALLKSVRAEQVTEDSLADLLI
ncbi:MAG: iron-containing redox enzyme family protein [Actinomycetota bacterium]|nr:iron-containing redox enzyme family protein [Actinomycetota bacterium]